MIWKLLIVFLIGGYLGYYSVHEEREKEYYNKGYKDGWDDANYDFDGLDE